jgi:hypothetical protein
MDALRACVLVVGLAGGVSCGGAAPATSSDDTTGAESSVETSSGGPTCTPGYEGCPCAAGLCLMGLACYSDLCVMAPDPTTSTSIDPDSSSGATGTESSTGDTSSDSGPAESSSESSSTGPVAECMPDETACAEGMYQTCVDGSWQNETCNDVCAPNGYASSGCADALTCLCDQPTDDHCNLGVTALCFCIEQSGSSCSADDETSFYDTCFDGSEPAVGCFADLVMNNTIDCNVAIDTCL